MARTPLFHTTLLGGLTGLSFTIGDTLLFTTAEDEQVYIVDAAQVLTQTPVAPQIAPYITQTVIEPRLQALAAA